MFSTFTGNSRRPRNVNLSGQAGNPFTNTSWAPSNVSNATKTVSDAQAEREKRQAERQRLKAAGTIQQVWRGHRTRQELSEARRRSFDELYSSSQYGVAQRLPAVFSLLLAFCQPNRKDDVERLSMFVRDCESVDLATILPNSQVSRAQRFTLLIVGGIHTLTSNHDGLESSVPLLRLLVRLISRSPDSLKDHTDEYYEALAKLCRFEGANTHADIVASAVGAPLRVANRPQPRAYHSLAFVFLAAPNLHIFENRTGSFSRHIDIGVLSEAVTHEYSPGHGPDKLLRLLSHFIALGMTLRSSSNLAYLSALYLQTSSLSAEIRERIDQTSPRLESKDAASQPLELYVVNQLLSLVDHDGISRLLHDFSQSLRQDSKETSQGAGVLAGYILTLLQSFPSKAENTRMRLFLSDIPTAQGPVPTVQFLWQIMEQTSVFRKITSEREDPLSVLKRYVKGTLAFDRQDAQDQEWRVILLFLEVYVFVLLLSDDEDFFSGIKPGILESASPPSRIRTCSLSLQAVKTLSIFLKNSAFALFYHARSLSWQTTRQDGVLQHFGAMAKMESESLRTTITTALKMLYERDSRKQFLPQGHWLMTDKLDKLDQENFVHAVIAEEESQNELAAEDSDSDDDPLEIFASYPQPLGGYNTTAGQRVSRQARFEQLKLQHARAQRQRRLAELGPKLEILKHMPFTVPFETRVTIFRKFIDLDRGRRHVDDLPFFAVSQSKHHAKIRRGVLFEDAFRQFFELGGGLRDPIYITFLDQFETPEAGIDGGGVTKEFLTSITREVFYEKTEDQEQRLSPEFSMNNDGLLYPDPTALDRLRESLRRHGVTETDERWSFMHAALLNRYEFLGRVIGKCLYEGILIDVSFAGFFLLKWASAGRNDETSYKGSINDLRDMDEDLYKGLLRLKNYPGDVSELGLDFTIEDEVSQPGQPTKTITRNLIPNGDKASVYNDNRPLYISYAARHRLVVQPGPQTSAFLRGLASIIKPSWLSMFNQLELQRLVGGDSSSIDIDDLRANTVYSGLYEVGDDGQEHPTIKLFWKVMRSFTDAQRRDVLKYVSSTPRAPLLGFSQLRPSFSIRDSGSDEKRLPSTSTCVNLLKLPRYTTESTLREKLLYAVTSGAGFDLS